MERVENIIYKTQGEVVDSDEFIRLLCESIKKILESKTDIK